MLKGRFESIKNASAGMFWAFRTQPNFKIHLALSLISILGGVFFKISYLEFLVIIIFISIGLVIEMLNTAIEKTNDAIDKSWRRDIKLAKDLSAGAMLIFSIMAFITACIIFLPRILSFFIFDLQL